MSTLALLCRIPTHAGSRWYVKGHFGCDACEKEADK